MERFEGRRTCRLSGLLLVVSVVATACGASPQVVAEVEQRRQVGVAAAAPNAASAPDAGIAGAAGSDGNDPAAAGTAGAPSGDGPAEDGTGDASGSPSSPTTAGRSGAQGDSASAGADTTTATPPAGRQGASDSSAASGPQAQDTPSQGGATDVGVTANTIRIGSTFFNGGFLDKYSQASEQAVRAYVNFVNDQGGIHGRKIELVTCDTQGTVNGTQACVKQLVEQDDVFALGPGLDFNMGTVIPYVDEQGIPWVGTAGLEEPEWSSPHMFPTMLRGGHVGDMMATFAADELGASSIGVSYLTNGAGPACLAEVERLAGPIGYEVAGTASNGDTESDLGGQVTKIRQEDPDVIVFCNDPVNNIKFMQAAARQNYAPPKGWINGYGATDDIPQAVGPPAEGMYAIAPFTWYRNDDPAVQRFRSIVQNYYPNIIFHTYMQGNYIGAEAMVKALAETGPELTRERYLETLRSMTDYDTGMGLRLDFSRPGEATPDAVFVQADENLQFQQVTGRITGHGD